MVLAFAVYIFILVFMTSFGIVATRGKKYCVLQLNTILPIIIVSLIMGFRYDVGTDWENYQAMYCEILKNGITWSSIVGSTLEPLYLILNAVIAYMGLPYQIFFAIIMFLHLILLYKSFDHYPYLLPLGLFFYITTFFCTSLNIQRQSLSICIFIYSIRFILDKEFYKYCMCIIIAGLIHYSSFILLPVYFLSMNFTRVLDKRLIQLSLYACSFFIFNFALNIINNFVLGFITNAKYLSNLNALGNVNMGTSSGLGVIATIVVDIFLIIYSKRLSIVYSKYKFNVIFRIYYVGIVMSNIFGLDMFLSRLFLAMENMRFIVLAFFVYYLINVKRTEFSYAVGCSLIVLYLLMYLGGIYNGNSGCSPFAFA